MNEHGLRNRQKLNIADYKSFTKNRENMNMGGVSISVKDSEAKSTLKVGEGKDKNEYLITRHNQFSPPINVFTVYGETESRTSNDEAEEKWGNILTEIGKIEGRKENMILVGDMNKHIGDDELGVPSNHAKISRGCLLYTSPSPRD